MDLLSALRVSSTTSQALSEGFRQHSSDISSAQNPDYHRQEVIFTSLGAFRGARLNAIKRVEDDNLLSELLGNLANKGFSSALSTYGSILRKEIGFDRENLQLVKSFENVITNLLALQAEPNSEIAEKRVVDSLRDLITDIHEFSVGLEKVKNTILTDISNDIGRVNELLVDIRDLNSRIQRHQARGIPTSAIEGNRDSALRELAEFVPIQILRANDFGAINVYLTSGHSLVSGGFSARLNFDAGTRRITIDGLSDNAPLATAEGRLSLAGGAIAAKFDLVLENTATTIHTFNDQRPVALIDKLGLQLTGIVTNLFFSRINTLYSTTPLSRPTEFTGTLFVANNPLATTVTPNNIILNRGVDDPVNNRFKVRAVTIAGNNNLITALQEQDKTIFFIDLAVSLRQQNKNIQGLLNGITSSTATILNAFDDDFRLHTEVSDQLRANITNKAGVNIDETLLIVNQIQKAFSANSKIFSTIDQMLAELLSAV